MNRYGRSVSSPIRNWLALFIAAAVTAVSMSVLDVPIARAQRTTQCPSPQAAPVPLDEASLPLIRPAPPLTADERVAVLLYPRASRSVVEIEFSRGSDFISNGSGFLWDNEGHVVTNSHVLPNDATSFRVSTTVLQFYRSGPGRPSVWIAHERTYDAELVGRSLWHDLAVLKIALNAEDTSEPVTVANYPVAVGQSVYAIGYPTTGREERTLTTGIISGLSRDMPTQNGPMALDLIQTDASVNPGNSGGPLFDSAGNLIGVNTLTAINNGNRVETAGFAVPVEAVCRVVPELISSGHYSRPRLGAMRGAFSTTGGAAVYLSSTSTPPGPFVALVDTAAAAWATSRHIEDYSRLTDVIDALWADLDEKITIQRIGDLTVGGTVDLWRVLDNFRPNEEVVVEALDSNGRAVRKQVRLLDGPSLGDSADQLSNPLRSW